jgi:hypothetical protein
MSIDHESPEPAGPGQTRPTGDPLQMTEAEKRAAEWEARHDVAARGRRAGAETVQHYVAHERLVHPAQPHPSAVPAAPKAQEQPVQPASPSQQPRPRPRSLLRRLFRRGD